ncbi:MAG: hypothetical protein ACRYF0_10900 [Janthinobacterium lividum]
MQRTLIILGLASLAACQHSSPATQVAIPTHQQLAKSPLVLPAASVPSLFNVGDTLTKANRAVLQRYNLSQLWQGYSQRQQNSILEGVFGPDHYRFELTFQQVERDPQRPDYYQVRGKCHYRKNVRPFTGWLIVRELLPLEPPYEEDDGSLGLGIRPDSISPDSFMAREQRIFSKINYYALRAEVRLVEQPAPNSGELRGEALLNFYVTPNGRLGFAPAPMRPTDGIWREGALLVRGSRRNVTTHQLKSFVVADNVYVAAADVYQDFGLGDRSYETEINPKYSHLGWNEKWENDEWGADSPTPSLNL